MTANVACVAVRCVTAAMGSAAAQTGQPTSPAPAGLSSRTPTAVTYEARVLGRAEQLVSERESTRDIVSIARDASSTAASNWWSAATLSAPRSAAEPAGVEGGASDASFQ